MTRMGILASLMAIASFASAGQLIGKCTEVLRGDFVTVSVKGTNYNVELREVMCPRARQPFFKEATEFTSSQILGRLVRIEYDDAPMDNNVIGEIYYSSKISLSQVLLQKGLAWWNANRGSYYGLKTYETRAKGSRLGLWSRPDPVPPWEFYKKALEYKKKFEEEQASPEGN